MSKTLATLAQKMLKAALKAVDPFQLITEQLRIENDRLLVHQQTFDLNRYRHIYVVGAGKASGQMALAIEKLLGPRIDDGLIVVKYGHGAPTQKIRILEAGHPVPDQNTLIGGEEILRLAEKAGEDDLVIVLLSGGGSALMEALPKPLTLDDLQKLNEILLGCGATIQEINAVRKHISRIKGGQLARAVAPATGLTFILSDVIGDPLDSIASGPTVPDPTTFKDAWQVLEHHQVLQHVPPRILRYLEHGLNQKINETPKQEQAFFKAIHNFILGNNLRALTRAAQVAKEHGVTPLILTDRLQGEVREIAQLLGGIFASSLQNGLPVASPGCLLLGGEPTVTLKGKGKGGRNQEMALAVLTALGRQSKPFYFCSVGTDGTDGPTEAAGAWIDESTWQKVEALNLSPETFLAHNDSYHFFKALDQLVITGPTGTNVMDLLLFLH
jgi:glycerate-2-kinase